MFNADLMTTLNRIRSNEAKLAEIAQRRKQLEEEAKKRILPAVASAGAPLKKAKPQKVFKWKNLSKPKAEIQVRYEILALEVLQVELKAEQKASYSSRNNTAVLLVGGDTFGNVLFWDALRDFALVKTVVLREGGNTNQVKQLQFELKVGEKGGEEKAKQKDVPYVVATVGHDLFILDLLQLDILYSKEDTFRSEVQALVPVLSEQKVLCATLEKAISCYCGKTWQRLFTLAGHTESVLCLCYIPPTPKQPKSYRILSGSDDATIRVWDIAPLIPQAAEKLNAKLEELKRKQVGQTSSPIKSEAKKKEKGGDSETDEEDEEEDVMVAQFTECEKVLNVHSEFVNTICCLAQDERENGPGEALVLTGSGDFKICVLNCQWECIHVLSEDKFAKSILYIKPWFFLIYQTSQEEDEDMSFLQTFDTVSQKDPQKWKMSKSHNRLMRESRTLAQGINMVALMGNPKQNATNPPRNPPKIFPFVATAAADKAVVQVWLSPFRHKPPASPEKPKQLKSPMDTTGTSATKPPAAKIPLPKPLVSPPVKLGSPGPIPSVKSALTSAPAPTRGKQVEVTKKKSAGTVESKAESVKEGLSSSAGDSLAKKFVENILLLPDLSPDMQRLLRCCLKLHEE